MQYYPVNINTSKYLCCLHCASDFLESVSLFLIGFYLFIKFAHTFISIVIDSMSISTEHVAIENLCFFTYCLCSIFDY